MPFSTLAPVIPHSTLRPSHTARQAAVVAGRRLEPCCALADQGRGVGADGHVHGVVHARAVAGPGVGGVTEEGTGETCPGVAVGGLVCGGGAGEEGLFVAEAVRLLHTYTAWRR